MIDIFDESHLIMLLHWKNYFKTMFSTQCNEVHELKMVEMVLFPRFCNGIILQKITELCNFGLIEPFC